MKPTSRPERIYLRGTSSHFNIIDDLWQKKLVTIDAINENYSIAYSYWEQREANFIKYYMKEYNEITKKKITDILNEIWKGADKVLEQLEEAQKLNDYQYNFINARVENLPENTKHDMRIQLTNNAKQGNLFINSKNINFDIKLKELLHPYSNPGLSDAKIGQIYEQLVTTKELNPNINKIINDYKSQGISKMLNFLFTGNDKTTSSWAKKRSIQSSSHFDSIGTSLSLDGIILPNNFTINNGIIQDKKNKLEIASELDVELAMNAINLNNNPLAWTAVRDLQLMMDNFQGVGGINIKKWKIADAHGKAFTSSAEMQSRINTNLMASNYGRHVLTEDWAQLYNFYYVSQHLFNIISPFTVIFKTGDTFLWMSQVLKNYYFRFRLSGISSQDWKSSSQKIQDIPEIKAQKHKYNEFHTHVVRSPDIVMYDKIRAHNSSIAKSLWSGHNKSLGIENNKAEFDIATLTSDIKIKKVPVDNLFQTFK